MTRLLIPSGVFVALAGFLAPGAKPDPRDVPSKLAGTPAPAFSLPQFGGPSTVSAVDRPGRVGLDGGVDGVPETFVIAKQGVVGFQRIGPAPGETLLSPARRLRGERA